MLHDVARSAHILIGGAGVALYWTALMSRKGGWMHRAGGKAFFLVMSAVALSVGPVLILRPGPFDPAHVVQFTYLTLCVLTVCLLSFTAIRWKHDLARFRGWPFRFSGALILLLGLVVLGAGIAKGSALTMQFSWVGLVYGTAMLRFSALRAADMHPRWPMIWHLNGVTGLFNAVHGNLLAVLWRWLMDPAAGDVVLFRTQVLTVALALGLRLWFGRTRGAPLRLTRPAARAFG